MAEYKEILVFELKLQKIQPWKRIGGGCGSENWAYKTNIGEIFAKISQDKHVSNIQSVLFIIPWIANSFIIFR